MNTLLIELYEKNGDEFIKEIELLNYNLDKINKICPPEIPDDFNYCNGTVIEQFAFLELQKMIPKLKQYIFDDYHYDLITRS